MTDEAAVPMTETETSDLEGLEEGTARILVTYGGKTATTARASVWLRSSRAP